MLNDEGLSEDRSRARVRAGKQFFRGTRVEIPHYGERATAEMGNGFSLRKMLLQSARNMLEEEIADSAAERIIDDAQSLDVEDDYCIARAALAGIKQKSSEALAKERSLRKPRLRIEVRQEPNVRVLLHVLEGKRQIAGYFLQHAKFFFADRPGLARCKQQHAHRGVID